MATSLNEITQAIRTLEDAKFRLDQQRNERANCQSRLDQLQTSIPVARQAVVDAKAALVAMLADFDANN